MNRPVSLFDRFTRCWVGEPNTGCWLWTGLTVRGYGRIYEKSRAIRAHRLSYELYKGPIPGGLVVRHTCDQPCCVNPHHLLLGTQADNAKDRGLRGRHAVGEKSGKAKLTEAQVREIRKLSREEISFALIAKRFGVDQKTVRNIVRKKLWAHVG